MRANKVFFDLYSTGGGIPYEVYKHYYDKNDDVYIVLVDERVYTIVKRNEMFNKCLHYGCFLEHICANTTEQVRAEALEFIKSVNADYVSVDEFIRIEQEHEQERVFRAFRVAEKMISED